MIRKLNKRDESAVLNYLYQDPQINIFIIGDIESFGFDVDFQDVYAEFEQDQYQSVLLRYKDNIIYYCHSTRFNEEWLQIIQAIPYQFISGKQSLIDLIIPFFPTMKVKPMYFAEATSIETSFKVDYSVVKRVRTEEELGRVYDLLATISEFDSLDTTTREQYIQDHLRYLDESLILTIEENGRCISTAATVADTTKSAMVVAVATDPSARNKGYATTIMIALMEEYFQNRNKSLCLFFDNPDAGKIYHRLGFKNMDMWVMLLRKSE